MIRTRQQHLLTTITTRFTIYSRDSEQLISTFQSLRNSNNPFTRLSVVQATTRLSVYHRINNNLPRGQRVLLPRSTTAAIINRDEGRKIRGPTIIPGLYSGWAWMAVPPHNISEYSKRSDLLKFESDWVPDFKQLFHQQSMWVFKCLWRAKKAETVCMKQIKSILSVDNARICLSISFRKRYSCIVQRELTKSAVWTHSFNQLCALHWEKPRLYF